jgi:hypothetical protein
MKIIYYFCRGVVVLAAVVFLILTLVRNTLGRALYGPFETSQNIIELSSLALSCFAAFLFIYPFRRTLTPPLYQIRMSLFCLISLAVTCEGIRALYVANSLPKDPNYIPYSILLFGLAAILPLSLYLKKRLTNQFS